MANRDFRASPVTFEKFPVTLYGTFTLTGVGTFTSDAYGFSLASTGVGTWTITLQDKYAALLDASILVLASTDKDLVAQVKTEAVATTKQITFKTLAVTTATALANGDKLVIALTLRNSTK